MPHTSSAVKCWVITEGLIGTENQCIGIAENLPYTFETKRIQLNEPWKSLSPYLGFERASSFTPRLSQPWPDIVIASGRKSIAASRFIKKQSNGRCFTVQIQDPRISAQNFDLLAVPKHDPLRAENVIVTTATPNRITQERLDQAKTQFQNLSKLKAPRIAVLIGGKSKAYDMSDEYCAELAQNLKSINGTLMITASRRTPESGLKILKDTLSSSSDTYFWDGQGENPYFGFLAWADYILVTSDSASMISESCTTGKPVYMIPMHGEPSKRIKLLHENLIETGALRVWDGTTPEPYSYTPLNDAQFVANEIKKRYEYFTQSLS